MNDIDHEHCGGYNCMMACGCTCSACRRTVITVAERNLPQGEKITVREACRKRMALGGTDAEALEHGMTQLEAENKKLREMYDGVLESRAHVIAEKSTLLLQYREAVDALRTIKKEYREGTIKVAFGLPLELENVIRKADGLEPITVPSMSEKRNHGCPKCGPTGTCPSCASIDE